MTEASQSPDESLPDLEEGLSHITRPTATSMTPPPPLNAPKRTNSKRTRIQCALCDVDVSVGTRHCSVCRKCVVGFDHHCVYLNTCIGSRNYPLFIALLTCTIVLVTSQLTVTVYAMDCVRRRGDTATVVFVASLSVLPLLQLVSMLVLAFFHTYISCKGLRTYEWLRSFHERSSRLTAKTPTWPQGPSTPNPLDEGDPRNRRRIDDCDSPPSLTTSTSTKATATLTPASSIDSI